MSKKQVNEFVASMKQRWGFLDPWWEALRPHVHYCAGIPVGDVWGSSRRDGRTIDEASFRKKFQQVREALALLVAVERTHYTAYAYLLRKHWRVRLRKNIGEQLQEATKFTLQLDVGEQEIQSDDGFIKYDLVRFCGTQQRENASEEYLTALRRIAALDGNWETRTTGVDIEIPVKLMYDRYYDGRSDAASRRFAKTLTDIAQAEKEIQVANSPEKKDAEPRALRCTFVLEPMYVGFDMMELTPEVAKVLGNLLADGVRVTASHMLTSILRESPGLMLEARQGLGQLLQQIFATTRRDAHISYHSEPDSTDQDLQLVLSATMPSSDFEAMCSAMMLTQTTRSLSLVMNPWDEIDHEQRWKWLAYTLFSMRSRSSIEKLTICALDQPTAGDAQAFASILNSNHPEEELFGTPRGVVDERNATLRSGAPIRWEFDREGQHVLTSRLLALETPIPFKRTFSDDGESEWVNVLVPGFGRCQVERSNLDFDCTVENSSSCITSLAFDAADPYSESVSHAGGLIPCIESIGFALTSLTINGPRRADIDINAIIQCCPNLLELSLAKEFVDVQLDFSDYRAANTPVPELTFAWNNVMKFVNDLKDPEDPATRCLKRLRLDQLARWGLPNGDPRILKKELKEVLRMLRVNQRLEYLEVQSTFRQFSKIFSKFHGIPIFRQHEPLPRKCALAFLSVLAPRTASPEALKKQKVAESALAVGQIDRHVVVNIFSFAAAPVLREVYFEHIGPQQLQRQFQQLQELQAQHEQQGQQEQRLQ